MIDPSKLSRHLVAPLLAVLWVGCGDVESGAGDGPPDNNVPPGANGASGGQYTGVDGSTGVGDAGRQVPDDASVTGDAASEADAADAGPAADDCAPQQYPSPEFLVADYGAVGDGVNDDTAALKAAFAAVKVAGGTVRFGNGRTYLVSSRLELEGASGFALRGNGSTLKVADGTPTAAHNPLSFRDCSSFSVVDLTVDGNRQRRVPAEDAGGHNIRILYSRNFSFCRVSSNNAATDGFYLAPRSSADPTTYPSDGVLSQCHADYSFRQGMTITNARRLQVVDSSFTNTRGTAPEAGVDIEPNGGPANAPAVEHVLFRNCLFEGNEGYGITTGGQAPSARLTVEGTTFRNNGMGAMMIRMASTLVRNNLIEKHDGPSGIRLRDPARSNRIVVRDNTFRNNTNSDWPAPAWLYVHSDSGEGNFLLGNTFENNYGADLTNKNPAGTCAAGNVVDGVMDAPVGTCGAAPTNVGYGSLP